VVGTLVALNCSSPEAVGEAEVDNSGKWRWLSNELGNEDIVCILQHGTRRKVGGEGQGENEGEESFADFAEDRSG
jgi:hypothetical protein